jgi:hypothetical protein
MLGPGQPGVEFAYWRKHNRLQGWMENLWRERKSGEPIDGEFNCERVQLTLEDIDKLEQDINDRGLPETGGFFFGSDSYDDYENEDFGHKNSDLEFIKEARHYLQENKKVYYTSWW